MPATRWQKGMPSFEEMHHSWRIFRRQTDFKGTERTTRRPKTGNTGRGQNACGSRISSGASLGRTRHALDHFAVLAKVEGIPKGLSRYKISDISLALFSRKADLLGQMMLAFIQKCHGALLEQEQTR